jgi:hypothetical protein
MLTIDAVFQMAAHRGLKPRPWGGYKLKTYNGYSPEQRIRKWQALHLAIAMGLEVEADTKPCSICGVVSGSAQIQYHSEDYGSMSGHYPLCKGCHTRVHQRFAHPERWKDFTSQFQTGSAWFEKLPYEEIGAVTLGVVENKYPVQPQAVLVSPAGQTSPPQQAERGKSSCRSGECVGISDEMHQVRVAFIKAMGIDCAYNRNPHTGYKQEVSPLIRQRCLDEARALRERYADLIGQYGRNRSILEKMDSNLKNRDLRVNWR